MIAGLLFMAGMHRSEVSALRWADVAAAGDGDGILVTVRRSKTNQEGETNDVRYLKDGARARRPYAPRRHQPRADRSLDAPAPRQTSLTYKRAPKALKKMGGAGGDVRGRLKDLHRWSEQDDEDSFFNGQSKRGVAPGTGVSGAAVYEDDAIF